MTSEYRRGVEDATNPNNYTGLALWVGLACTLDDVLTDVRKKLLTKKVTKWVAVAISPSTGKPYAQGYFQDSAESAKANKTSGPGDNTTLGYYPIEIEVPID